MKVKHMSDGVYFVPADTNYIHINSELRMVDYSLKREEREKIENWYISTNKTSLEDAIKERNPEFLGLEIIYLCDAYETYGVFLLDKEPQPIKYIGQGFNYGSCNLIKVEEPGYILILAQND